MKPEEGSKQTILSEHDVAKMQMVEAMPSVEADAEKMQRNVPDMSVGWYSSPVNPHEGQE